MTPESSPGPACCSNVMLRSRALSIGLLAVMFLAGCTSPPERPATGEPLPPCGSAPNCVNSMSGEGGQAVEPLRATPVQWRALRQWLGAQEDWQVVLDTDVFVQAVAITPLMRYRDDVQLLYMAEDGLVHVRSSSRLGYSDMGANRDRIEALRELLADSGW